MDRAQHRSRTESSYSAGRPSLWRRVLIFGLLYALAIAIVLLMLGEVPFFVAARRFLEQLGAKYFGQHAHDAAMWLGLLGLLLLLFLGLRSSLQSIAASAVERPNLQSLEGGTLSRRVSAHQPLEDQVIWTGLVAGLLVGLSVFMIEHSKHAEGASDESLMLLFEFGLAALVGILVAIFVFVGSIVFSFDRRVGHIAATLGSVERSARDVTDSAAKVALIAVDIKTAARDTATASRTTLGISAELFKRLKELQRPMDAYLRALIEWIKRENHDGAGSSLTPTAHAVNAIIETYLREESGDIWRNSLVTNPRNYALFLTQTLSSLCRFVIGETSGTNPRKVHMYIVTPMSPMFIFNWPQEILQGSRPLRCNFVLPFLAQYCLCLQQLLRSNWSSRLSVRRWIPVRPKSAFAPQGDQDLMEDTRRWVVPVPITRSALYRALTSAGIASEHATLLAQAVAIKSCRGRNPFGETMSSEKDVGDAEGLHFYINMDSGNGKDQELLEKILKQRAALVEDAVDELSKLIKSVEDLCRPGAVVGSESSNLRQVLDDFLTVQEALSSEAGLRSADNIMNFYQTLQVLAVGVEAAVRCADLDTQPIPQPHLLGERLFEAAIYEHAAQFWLGKHSTELPNLMSLGQGFATSMHSADPSGKPYLKYVEWEAGREELVATKPVPEEFVLFALSDEEIAGDDDFVLGISATIEHPWRSAEVEIHSRRSSQGFLRRLVQEWHRVDALKEVPRSR